MKTESKNETANKVTITGASFTVPEKAKIAPELAAVQNLMPMSADDRAALRESMKRDGIREPLRGYAVGMTFYILSGFNRWSIACELNAEAKEKGEKPPFPLVKTETIETDDREAFAIDENRARRQLTLDDKRRLAAWLLKRNPAMSDKQAGKLAGIDDKTAGKVRAGLVSRSEIPNVEKRTDSKGRKTPARKPARPSPQATASPQSSAAGQGKGKGRGENEAALQSFTSGLNTALRSVSLENAQTLKAAISTAKAWLKDLERKQRAAEKVK